MKNFSSKEEQNKNRSQQQIQNNKSKKHTKKILKKYNECVDIENEEIYSNFEKFNNRN